MGYHRTAVTHRYHHRGFIIEITGLEIGLSQLFLAHVGTDTAQMLSEGLTVSEPVGSILRSRATERSKGEIRQSLGHMHHCPPTAEKEPKGIERG